MHFQIFIRLNPRAERVCTEPAGHRLPSLWMVFPIYSDPFDRILVTQAPIEGVTLLTSDEQVANYSGAVLRI
jgi:PIN domain nuclease of toxin-antitoxin system